MLPNMMKLTPEKLTAFCAALAETGIVARAVAAIGITRQTAYEWRREMPDFAAQWDRALKIGITALEDEAHRRAFTGVAEPLTHKGQFTYVYEDALDANGEPLLDVFGNVTKRQRRDKNGNPMLASVQKYSDTLAIFLLKAHEPEKYRENSHVQLDANISTSKMADAEIEQELAELEALEAARSAAPLPVEDFDDLA